MAFALTFARILRFVSMTALARLSAIFLISGLAPTMAGPKEDLDQFVRGEKLVWDSSRHPKAHGIRMKISYPRSWGAKEGNRPHMVVLADISIGKRVRSKAIPHPRKIRII
jgi:hypothetical protein